MDYLTFCMAFITISVHASDYYGFQVSHPNSMNVMNVICACSCSLIHVKESITHKRHVLNCLF